MAAICPETQPSFDHPKYRLVCLSDPHCVWHFDIQEKVKDNLNKFHDYRSCIDCRKERLVSDTAITAGPMIVASSCVDHGPGENRHFLVFLRFSANHLGSDHAGTNAFVAGNVLGRSVVVDVLQFFWKLKNAINTE